MRRGETFSPAAKLLEARAEHTAILLADGRVLVMGGRVYDRLLDSTEIFDPATNLFSWGPSLKRARWPRRYSTRRWQDFDCRWRRTGKRGDFRTKTTEFRWH